MQYDLLVVDDFFSEKDCDFWMYQWRKHETEHQNTGLESSLEILHLKSHLELLPYRKELIAKLDTIMPSYVEADYQQVVLMPSGSGLGTHKDVWDIEYSSIIYLNDDYEGGETYIGLPGHELNDTIVKPKTGRLVSFRGKDIPHGVNEVTQGTRFTLPAWYSTPEVLKKKRNLTKEKYKNEYTKHN